VKKAREAALVNACLDYLHMLGWPAWRANTTGVRRVDKTGREFWTPARKKGVSDILCPMPPCGRLLACECKMPGEVATPDQRAFLDEVSHAGGLAVIVRDVLELVAALKAEGVELRV
jgi:hypothetical protein